MKILLAIDGSQYTKKMLAYLATHDDFLSPAHEYHAISVQPSLSGYVSERLGKTAVTQYQKSEAEKVLAPVLTFLTRHKIKAQSTYKVGTAGEVVAKIAKNGNFDLIIMGSHGHSTLGSLVLGSTTNKVLANCDVPVLLIR